VLAIENAPMFREAALELIAQMENKTDRFVRRRRIIFWTAEFICM